MSPRCVSFVGCVENETNHTPGTSRKEAVTSERAVPSSASGLPGLMMGDDADALTLACRLGRSPDRDVLDVAVDY